MNKTMRSLLLASTAVAVPMGINAYIASRAPAATQPLPGDIGYYDWIYGRVAYYRLGQGPPLVLVHNPNAGGSSWEWRNVFPELANHFTVYALDLLGFGLSDKPFVPYTGAMLSDLVHDFLDEVIIERADVIGSALGASYLVNAVVRRPESAHKLVLVNPTGMSSPTTPITNTLMAALLNSPVLGTSLYFTLTAREAIRRELTEHIYYDPAMATPAVVQSLYAFAHQPGSQFSAAAFLAGKLNLPMRLAFSSLTQPVLLIWGRDAYYTPVGDAADLLYRHPQAQLEILDDCGMLPHDERAGEFLSLVQRFLAEPALGEMAA